MKKFYLLTLFLWISFFAVAQKFYTVDQIPNPKTNGQDYFVSNPDGILSNVSEMDEKLVQLEKETKVEFAVVVVKDFNQNLEDFEFAKAIFDKWGIGKAGSDNGLLLLVAQNRRKWRFISGDGVEGLLPDIVLKQIGEQNLVPAFKKNNYDAGILNAIDAVSNTLTNPNAKVEIQGLVNQEKQKNFDWMIVLGASLALILLFFIVFKLINKKSKKNTFITNNPLQTVKTKAIGGKNSKSKKKINQIIENQNGYDAVYVKGCVGIFFFIFISVFVIIFAGGFGLFEKFKITHIPYILYVLLAIGLFFRYYAYVGNLRRTHFDDENFFDAVKDFHAKYWWLIVFSPPIIIALLIHSFKKAKTVDRFKPIFDIKNKQMSRLDRDINPEGEPYLSKGQRKEELIKAYDYDIWISDDHTEKQIKVWPAEEYDSYTECPKCNFRTYQLNKQETTKSPSYSSTGTAKLTNECGFCNHVEFIRWVTLSKLVKSSSSSGGSSSSSSSSSSSGSFGGGSSSGGGAGGSW